MEARTDLGMLSRLWSVLDPALDVLPCGEVIDVVLERLREAFGAAVAELTLAGGGRRTTPGEEAWEAAGERAGLDVHVGLVGVGRLDLGFAAPAELDGPEGALLELAVARLGRAIARCQAEREAAEAEARLREENRARGHLYRISAALMAEHELQEVVQLVTEESTALTRAQFGAFFYNTLDDAGDALTLYTIAGAPREAFERFPMPRATAVFAPTFRGSATVRSDDITADPRYGRSAPHHGMPDGHPPVRSYLAVPVKARSGEVLGGMFFGHAEPGVFGEQAERTMEAMASLAAVAIESSSLHETAQRELAASRRAYRERDNVARVLQESLMPPRLPDIPGLELAAGFAPGEGVVGGDFYDAFPVRDGVWGAAIGDVQGKDARAAAMTSVVRHTLRSTALHRSGPADALSFVNRVVLQEQEPDDPRFASVLFALLEPAEDGLRVRLASAGHPPALVLRADGSVAECRAPGTLLGILAEPPLEDAETVLAPGDTLVLYTDGLTEARADGRLLGERPVYELLGAHARAPVGELAGRLGALAEAFSAGRRRDDLAVLLVRVT